MNNGLSVFFVFQYRFWHKGYRSRLNVITQSLQSLGFYLLNLPFTLNSGISFAQYFLYLKVYNFRLLHAYYLSIFKVNT